MPRKRKPTAPPSTHVSDGDSHCYAALAEVGLGTGRVAIYDQKARRTVAFSLPTFTLMASVCCAKLRTLGIVDGLHRAILPTGEIVHVRDIRDTLAVARGLKIYDAGDAA